MSDKKKVVRKDGKTSVGIRLNKELYAKFSDFCKREGYTKSGYIEKILRESLKSEKVIDWGVSLIFLVWRPLSKRLIKETKSSI